MSVVDCVLKLLAAGVGGSVLLVCCLLNAYKFERHYFVALTSHFVVDLYGKDVVIKCKMKFLLWSVIHGYKLPLSLVRPLQITL